MTRPDGHPNRVMPAMLKAVVLACLLVLLCAVAARPAEAAQRWKPAPGTSWQWQLSGKLDTSFDVDAYDVDGFETSAGEVRALHRKGSKAICYVSAGSWERWRPDAGRFPERVVGEKLDGWPGERWLDIRRTKDLAPIMRQRLDMCREKGFDAVEPDNIQAYVEDTGFRITYKDQLRYNKWLAKEAHARGLSIALKNDLGQVKDLLPYYDFAIVEECFRYRECGRARPFVRAGKAVLVAEYAGTGVRPAGFCPDARRLRFDAIFKRYSLGPWRISC